jgi:hypothetical protein
MLQAVFWLGTAIAGLTETCHPETGISRALRSRRRLPQQPELLTDNPMPRARRKVEPRFGDGGDASAPPPPDGAGAGLAKTAGDRPHGDAAGGCRRGGCVSYVVAPPPARATRIADGAGVLISLKTPQFSAQNCCCVFLD